MRPWRGSRRRSAKTATPKANQPGTVNGALPGLNCVPAKVQAHGLQEVHNRPFAGWSFLLPALWSGNGAVASSGLDQAHGLPLVPSFMTNEIDGRTVRETGFDVWIAWFPCIGWKVWDMCEL